MTYRCECSYSGSDKVGINVLRFVDLSPIITCLTIKCSYPLQPGGRRSVGYIAGHFQGFVCAGQTQAVHWICLGCFTRRHVEESWVEETRLVNKAAKRGMTCVSDFSSRVIVGVHVKPIFGYLWREESVAIVEAETLKPRGIPYPLVNIQPCCKQIPKLFMVGRIGEPARHTNDGKLWSL